MQPYQEASQEIRRQGEMPLKIAKGAAGAGATVGAAALGAGIGRVIPFLSKYVPQDLAIKGLNKIDPRFGKFIQTALDAGESFEGVKEFIGGKIEEEQSPTKQNGNIIEQYSPNLFQYMKDLMGKGSSPIDAAAKARKFLDKKQQDIISKMEKDHKTDWSSIVQSVFGGQGMAQPQPQQGQQQQPAPPGQSQQGGQQGEGRQKLMQILGMINQKLGQ